MESGSHREYVMRPRGPLIPTTDVLECEAHMTFHFNTIFYVCRSPLITIKHSGLSYVFMILLISLSYEKMYFTVNISQNSLNILILFK